METTTSAISVQIDSHDKELAANILKNLGLNMSTFVNMAIKQLINKDGITFENFYCYLLLVAIVIYLINSTHLVLFMVFK